MRCELNIGGMRGVVVYKGIVGGLECGYWIGIKLDEPVGENNGNVGGKKYFDCG